MRQETDIKALSKRSTLDQSISVGTVPGITTTLEKTKGLTGLKWKSGQTDRYMITFILNICWQGI